MPGIIRSRMMTSGVFALAAARPVSPLKALSIVRQFFLEEIVEGRSSGGGLRLIGGCQWVNGGRRVTPSARGDRPGNRPQKTAIDPEW